MVSVNDNKWYFVFTASTFTASVFSSSKLFLRVFVSCGRTIPVIYTVNSFCVKESGRKEGVRDSFCTTRTVGFFQFLVPCPHKIMPCRKEVFKWHELNPATSELDQNKHIRNSWKEPRRNYSKTDRVLLIFIAIIMNGENGKDAFACAQHQRSWRPVCRSLTDMNVQSLLDAV